MSDLHHKEGELVYDELARQEIAAQSQVVTKDSRKAGTSIVAVIGIIALAFIALTCIVACAAVASVFIQNAPW